MLLEENVSVRLLRKVGDILFHGTENIVMTYFSTVMYEFSFFIILIFEGLFINFCKAESFC